VEERMGLEVDEADAPYEMRTTFAELSPQVARLEANLADRCRQGRRGFLLLDERVVELVASCDRFDVHRREIGRDRRQRVGSAPEASELWVVPVASRPALEDALGEERLAPERDEALGVEVSRVKGPEPHG
jgi:hypothetical protein